VLWYLLRTEPRQERRAVASLTELRLETYLPLETVWRKINRVSGPYGRALFAGYLFARLPDRLFYAAVNADGVRGAVYLSTANGDRTPCVIAPQLVEEIRAAEARGDFDLTKPEPLPPPLEVGDQVRVSAGHFAGKLAAIAELRAHERVALLINSKLIEVDVEILERVA
jgi:transcriptional antiterminator RfaH